MDKAILLKKILEKEKEEKDKNIELICLQMLQGKLWIIGAWIARLPWLQEYKSSTNELGYTVDTYDESPEVYYEHFAEATLYNTQWKTVVYVNLKQTDSESDLLGQYNNHVNKLCHATQIKNWTDCNHFYTITKDRFRQVRGSEKLLKN
jgi:hypothetical protein